MSRWSNPFNSLRSSFNVGERKEMETTETAKNVSLSGILIHILDGYKSFRLSLYLVPWRFFPLGKYTMLWFS